MPKTRGGRRAGLLTSATLLVLATGLYAGTPVFDPGRLSVSGPDRIAPLASTPALQGALDLTLWATGSPLATGDAGLTFTDIAYWDRAKTPRPEDAPGARTSGEVFFKGWLTITAFEAALLTATATAPKEWTGWSPRFVQDGLGNFRDAYSAPPAWDSDSWEINYVGHPYAGSIYYNTVRSQGASKTSAFLFTFLMSTQWEYSFEALAEHPSTQDLIVTPVAGAILGEFTHNLTRKLTPDGSGVLERVLLTVLNPAHTVTVGF